MSITALKTLPLPGTATFPRTEVEKALRKALDKVAADAAVLKDPWEPQLDSLAVVKVVIVVEAILPGVTIAPEKVVKKGGYANVDEGVADMVDRIEKQWQRAR